MAGGWEVSLTIHKASYNCTAASCLGEGWCKMGADLLYPLGKLIISNRGVISQRGGCGMAESSCSAE